MTVNGNDRPLYEVDTASAGELESSFQEIFRASEASETERSVNH